MPQVTVVGVFAAGPGGGHPAPVVDADGLSDEAMRQVAREHVLESGSVLPPEAGGEEDFRSRSWVPQHEMEMCGHATVGAVWSLSRLGRLPRDTASIRTRSGLVRARVREGDGGGPRVEVSQPRGRVVLHGPWSCGAGADGAVRCTVVVRRTARAAPAASPDRRVVHAPRPDASG